MQRVDIVSVETVLVALVSGGAAGTVTYWLIAELVKAWAWFAGVCENPVRKRFVGFGLAGVLAVGAWLAGIALLLWPAPDPGWRAWLIATANVLISGGMTSIVVANTWHSLDLSKRYKASKEQAEVKARLAAQEKQFSRRR